MFLKYFFYPENDRGIRFESSVLAKLLIEELFCLAARRYLLIGDFTDLRQATIGFLMSVRPFVYVSVSSWTNSSSTKRIFMKFCSWIFFENLIFFEYNKNNGQLTRRFTYIYGI
jgi:hypothetical protein